MSYYWYPERDSKHQRETLCGSHMVQIADYDDVTIKTTAIIKSIDLSRKQAASAHATPANFFYCLRLRRIMMEHDLLHALTEY